MRYAYLFVAYIAVALHNQRIARFDGLHGIVANVHNGLDYRTFRCYHHNLVVLVVVGWAYAPGVAHHKGVAVAHEACHGIAAIEIFGGGL